MLCRIRNRFVHAQVTPDTYPISRVLPPSSLSFVLIWLSLSRTFLKISLGLFSKEQVTYGGYSFFDKPLPIYDKFPTFFPFFICLITLILFNFLQFRSTTAVFNKFCCTIWTRLARMLSLFTKINEIEHSTDKINEDTLSLIHTYFHDRK